MAKPKIFIGSSVEGLNIAYAIQQNLTQDAEITVWDQGVFELSQTSIESLVAILEKSDFAILVFSPDDILKIRKQKFLSVRDNVIFELGLFIGKLGRRRTFIIMPDKPVFHIPTDLLGITAGKYDTSRTDGSFQAATAPICHQIRIQIKKLGLLQIDSTENVAQRGDSEVLQNEELKEKGWWSLYFERKYKEAVELLIKEIDKTEDKEKKDELIVWKIYIELKIDSKEGKKKIEEKLRDDPDNKYTYASLTRILLWEDELEMAIRIIEEGLTKFNKDEVLISRKREYLEKIGKLDDAIALILESNYVESEFLSIKLAELYEDHNSKKTEDAFSVIYNSYIKNQTSEQLTNKLGRLAQDTNRNSLALFLFDKLTKKYPDNVSYWGNLGNTCNDLSLHNKAMIAYKKGNELASSKESWILENIGNLLKNQGFYADARKYFNESLVIDPNSEYSFKRIATIIKAEEEEEEEYLKFIKEGLNDIANQSEPKSSPDK